MKKSHNRNLLQRTYQDETSPNEKETAQYAWGLGNTVVGGTYEEDTSVWRTFFSQNGHKKDICMALALGTEPFALEVRGQRPIAKDVGTHPGGRGSTNPPVMKVGGK